MISLDRFSDTELILGVLAGFYLAECACWLRHGAVASCAWFGDFRRLGSFALVENERGHLQYGSPAPAAEVFLCDRWQLSLGPQGVSLRSAEGEMARSVRPGGSRFLPFDDAFRVRIDGHLIGVGNLGSVAFACPESAEPVADALKDLSLAAPARRPSIIAKFLDAATDTDTIAYRFAEFQNTTRSVRLSSVLLVLYTFVCGPLLYYLALDAWARIVWIYIVGFVGLWYLTIFNFYVAHRLLFPAKKKQRRDRIFSMLFSPADAMHAAKSIAKPLLSEFHPVAIAAVICSTERFVEYGRQVLLELRYPKAIAADENNTAAADTEAYFRARLLEKVESVLGRAQQDPAAALLTPQALPDARSYCPRCLMQFVHSDGCCDRCTGVTLQAFDEHRNDGHTDADDSQTPRLANV